MFVNPLNKLFIFERDGGPMQARRAGANARNSLFHIWYFNGLKNLAERLGQEVFEREFKWKWLLAIYLPILFIALKLGGDAAIMLGVFGFLATFLTVTNFSPLKRRMEIGGHNIESIGAADLTDTPYELYAMMEAHALTNYKQFKGWSAEKIYDAMRRDYPKRIRWWRTNRNWLIEKTMVD